jgi:hypothetical protein
MAVDLLYYSLKVSVGRHIVQNSENLPSWREAGIHLDKLNRALGKVAVMLSDELELDAPGKKIRKRRGRETQRLDRQSKLVDKFLTQLTIESNKANNKKLEATPKQLRAAVEQWMKQLNRNLHTSSRMLLPGPPMRENIQLPGFKGTRPRKHR